MMCEACKINKAHIVLRQAGDAQQSIHLCENCAATGHYGNKRVQGLDKAMVKNIKKSPLRVNEIYQTQCSKCHLTYTTYKQLGKLGCVECTKAFGSKLIRDVSDCQYGQQHSGKSPIPVNERVMTQKEIMVLKRALNYAIEHENYQLAAELRDKVTALEEASDES